MKLKDKFINLYSKVIYKKERLIGYTKIKENYKYYLSTSHLYASFKILYGIDIRD